MKTTASASSPQSSPSGTAEARHDVACRTEIVARGLAKRSRGAQWAAESRAGAQRTRLMEDAPGKAFLLAMVDEVFRSQ